MIDQLITMELPPKCILSLGDLGSDAKRIIDTVSEQLRKRMGDDAPVMIVAGAQIDQIQILQKIKIPFNELKMNFRLETEDGKQFLIIEPKKEAVAA